MSPVGTCYLPRRSAGTLFVGPGNTWSSPMVLMRALTGAGRQNRLDCYCGGMRSTVRAGLFIGAARSFASRGGVESPGKDPFAAALALVELLGPCRFGGWDPQGDPVVAPHPSPWVQVAAVSQDQTRNTMTLLPGLLGTKAKAKALGVDLGKTIIYGPGSARLEAVTSNPRALEGSRPSMVILGETHHWLPSNDGREMARAVARNLAKSRDGSARALAITNAHAPGENSVAEADYDAWAAIDGGKSRASGLMYDSLSAPADVDLADSESLKMGINLAKGDSVWVDAERLAQEVLDPTTPVSMSRRFYLNQVVAPEDAWVSAVEWDRCHLQDKLAPGDLIAVGFDGSRKDDATALVAVRVTDGFISPLGVWQAPPNEVGWEVDRDAVDAAVRQAAETYDIAGMYCDLAYWESYVDMWRDSVVTTTRVRACGSHPLSFDMRGRRADFTRAADRFASDVQQRQLTHDGDRVLRQHVLNARRAPNRWGVSIRKEAPMSQRKIDLAVASVLAWQARNDVIAAGPRKIVSKGRPGRVKAFS